MRVNELIVDPGTANETHGHKVDRENLTLAERQELMVSNIYGLMDYDSQVTKEEIREALKKISMPKVLNDYH